MAETLTKPSTSSPDASGDRDKGKGRSSPAQENLQGLEKVFVPYEGFLGTSATKEQLRRSIAEPVQTALEEPAGDASFLDALLGTSMLEPPIERHAAIMSDPRFSHPANAPTSSRIVNRLHQTYGNGHVQTIVDLVQAIQDEGLSAEQASADIYQTIARKRGAGKPLEHGTRAQMDRAFGRDFSDVSVHTDSAADSLAWALQAKALAIGNDVLFRETACERVADEGINLPAHWPAYVVEHRYRGPGGRVQRGGLPHTGPATTHEVGTVQLAEKSRKEEEPKGDDTKRLGHFKYMYKGERPLTGAAASGKITTVIQMSVAKKGAKWYYVADRFDCIGEYWLNSKMRWNRIKDFPGGSYVKTFNTREGSRIHEVAELKDYKRFWEEMERKARKAIRKGFNTQKEVIDNLNPVLDEAHRIFAAKVKAVRKHTNPVGPNAEWEYYKKAYEKYKATRSSPK